MSKTTREQGIHALRSVLMILLLTVWSTYFIRGLVFPPRGNPLLYSLAMSWLIGMTIAVVTSAIFFRVNPKLFSLAGWEKEGQIYDRAGLQGFRWALLHSPLGWINANFHLRISKADYERLRREMNASEGVHWLTCVFAGMLAISCFRHGYAVYGYAMLLVRIPFDLYPIMLQRRNRGRLSRVLERKAPSGPVVY